MKKKISRQYRNRLIRELSDFGIDTIASKPTNRCTGQEIYGTYKRFINCKDSQTNPSKAGYVYFIGSTERGYCKIGYSKNPESRLR
ncbi:MAG: hypothetical protein ACOC4J_06185, partial [Bacteroidota bacterium]